MAAITGEIANSLVEADFSGQEGPGPWINNYGSVVTEYFLLDDFEVSICFHS